MLIKQGFFVKNLDLSSRKSPITYTYGGAHSIKVLLKQESKKNLPPGATASCRAWGSYKPSKKIEQYLIDISKNELPKEMASNKEALNYLNETAKTVERVHIDYFPQSFKDFMRNVRTELHDVIKRTVNIFMWRCGIPRGHNSLFNGGMSFSLDGKKWNMIPPGIKVFVSSESIPPLPKHISLNLKKLINNAQDQPLGHQLYREAQVLRNTNPRISILVAMSALEVSVKECVSKLSQDSNWLVENLPSPDIRKLINQYIPMLLCETTLEKVLPLPKYLDDTIRKGVHVRNQVAHLGREAPSRESTDEILSAVQDVIWLLDVCSGHDWASKYLCEPTIDHLKVKTQAKG